MASKEKIAEMSNAERVKALNKAIKKQVNKHFDGTSLKAEVEIRVSKCDACDEENDGRISTHIKEALDRMMKRRSGLEGELGSVLLDELEKAAMSHPALKKDAVKAAQVKRMFDIRKELNALIDQEERFVGMINGKIPFDAEWTKETAMSEVKALDEKQRKLLDELQAL
jgi:hypothetical protein